MSAFTSCRWCHRFLGEFDSWEEAKAAGAAHVAATAKCRTARNKALPRYAAALKKAGAK